jgi:hypothetical protein
MSTQERIEFWEREMAFLTGYKPQEGDECIREWEELHLYALSQLLSAMVDNGDLTMSWDPEQEAVVYNAAGGDITNGILGRVRQRFLDL